MFLYAAIDGAEDGGVFTCTGAEEIL